MLEEYKEAEKYIEKALTLDFDYTLDYGKLLVVDYAQTMIVPGEYEKAMRIYHDMGDTKMEEYFAQKYRESAPDTN